jgi:hypothetical protein
VADVFISYKRAERARVESIADLLKEAGLDVWFDARLEVGRSEGFDAEIEREVTSAACVVVCWTPEAIRSVYVRAEAKKGLEREVLVPLFLDRCVLPVPFNDVDAIDLIGWRGETLSPGWLAFLEQIKATISRSRSNEQQRIAHSHAAYERIADRIYPGTLKLLVDRLVAKHETDARDFHEDVLSLLEWLAAVLEKEARYNEYSYEIATRQDGGGAWYWWEDGKAAERSRRLAEVQRLLSRIDTAISSSRVELDKPTP